MSGERDGGFYSKQKHLPYLCANKHNHNNKSGSCICNTLRFDFDFDFVKLKSDSQLIDRQFGITISTILLLQNLGLGT